MTSTATASPTWPSRRGTDRCPTRPGRRQLRQSRHHDALLGQQRDHRPVRRRFQQRWHHRPRGRPARAAPTRCCSATATAPSRSSHSANPTTSVPRWSRSAISTTTAMTDLALGVPCENGTGALEIFRGNGDGTFAATPISQTIYSSSNPGTFSGPLAARRLQRRRQSRSSPPSPARCCSATVTGHLSSKPTGPRAFGTLQIAVADLNGDGYQDLIEVTNQFGVGDSSAPGPPLGQLLQSVQDAFSAPQRGSRLDVALPGRGRRFQRRWPLGRGRQLPKYHRHHAQYGSQRSAGGPAGQISLPIAAAFRPHT